MKNGGIKMPNGEVNANKATTWEVTKESWLTTETYNQAINARHAGEQSYLSIVNAHMLANTILFATISLLATNVLNNDYAGKTIATMIALLGVVIACQTRVAFLIARGNNICWDEVIREYERKRPIFPSPTNGGLYTLNCCVMKNGKTCKASLVSVAFEGENKNIETAILHRDKPYAKRMKMYPWVFMGVYVLLIAFIWRDHFKNPF